MATRDTLTNSSPNAGVHHTPALDKLQKNCLQKQNLQHLLHSNPLDGWKRCWEGVTPWDLGEPAPIIQHLLDTNSFPKGRALVPGCGSGYDVVALASPERYVIGLELSDVAINKAKELASSSPNANYCSFLLADFFTWEPTELFDVIFDYSFFCAIVPDMRQAWADCVGRLLKPDGELIIIMFMIGDDDKPHEPPYKTTLADYEEVLQPLGFHATSIVENELAVSRCKGREKLGRWRRMTN